MTFWKTVLAVALGIILSGVLLFAGAAALGLSAGLIGRGVIEAAKDAALRQRMERSSHTNGPDVNPKDQ